MSDFITNFIALFMDAAFWLLLGLLLAGLIKVWMPTRWMQTHLSQEGYRPVIKAALLGAPLPLCSCGVIPAALGIRRAGASKGATISFLIATPETGVDSIAVTYALLGPVLAIVRPIAAIFSAIAAGLGAGMGSTPQSTTDQPTSGCCQKTSCSSQAYDTPVSPPFLIRLRAGLKFGFQEVIADIALWMLAGLLFAAAVATWVPPEMISQWGSGLPAMLAMIVIGIPMYVCATASTPIAAGLLLAGISPGTVLVFMLAGPATNISTVAIVHKELGLRPLIAYLGGVILVAITFGLALDTVLGQGLLPEVVEYSTDSLLPNSVNVLCAILLGGLFLQAILKPMLARLKH